MASMALNSPEHAQTHQSGSVGYCCHNTQQQACRKSAYTPDQSRRSTSIGRSLRNFRLNLKLFFATREHVGKLRHVVLPAFAGIDLNGRDAVAPSLFGEIKTVVGALE